MNPPQKVSDVTMRSVNKPERPRFAQEEMFYIQHSQEQYYTDGYDPYYSSEYTSDNLYSYDQDYEFTPDMSGEEANRQDFPQDEDQGDHSW